MDDDSVSIIFGLPSSPALSSLHFEENLISEPEIPRGRLRNFQLPPATYGNVVQLSQEVYSVQQVCCNEHCLIKFSPQEIWELHKCFLGKNETEQRQYLLSCFNSQATKTSPQPNSTVVVTNFVLKGKSVCSYAFCQLQGVSSHKFSCAENSFKEGYNNRIHGNQGMRSMRYVFPTYTLLSEVV